MQGKVIVLALAAVLAGCGGTGWKAEYSCPGMPSGVMCKSPIEVYKMTENASQVTRESGSGNALNQDANTDASKTQSPAATAGALRHIPSQVSAGRDVPRDAMPILEPAKVMRVWIAPWIDGKQDLHMPGYVFTEVTPRRWSFGEAAAFRGKPLVPLQVDMKDRASGGEDGGMEIGDEAKTLMPKGLVQGMQQQQQGRAGQPMGAMPAGVTGMMQQGVGATQNLMGGFQGR